MLAGASGGGPLHDTPKTLVPLLHSPFFVLSKAPLLSSKPLLLLSTCSEIMFETSEVVALTITSGDVIPVDQSNVVSELPSVH